MIRLETRARIVFLLAAVVLAGGVLSALLVRHARSASTREVMDPAAAREAALGILENTASLAGRWREPDADDVAALDIDLQESLALLREETRRSEDLEETARAMAEGGDGGAEEEGVLLDSLALLREAQEELARAFGLAREALSGLYSLREGQALYAEARDRLLAAIDAHNQAVASLSRDLSSARQKASEALVALGEARAEVESAGAEGLDRDAALSAISGLEKTTGDFIQACVKGESGDVTSHNELMAQVRTSLAAAPADLAEALDIRSWLGGLMAPLLQEVEGRVAETRSFLDRR